MKAEEYAYGTSGVISLGVQVKLVTIFRYIPSPGLIMKSVPDQPEAVHMYLMTACLTGSHQPNSVIFVCAPGPIEPSTCITMSLALAYVEV